MNLDKLRERWQALDASLTPNADADDVTAACRGRASEFRTKMLVSDILEIGTGLVMAWVWAFPFTRLFAGHKPLMYLGAAAILFVCAFLVGARVLRHRNAKPEFASVSDELRRHLYAVNQQIWLLRNLIWWYLLPAAFAILTVLIAVVLEAEKAHVNRVLINEAMYIPCCLLLFVGIYYWNQRAVRKDLLPLKKEVERILLDMETVDGR
ncbi:MAG TPA: hypothetical protein PLO37_03540 [Candidatus Hydrogenedentes bacterium]|nr:hypothetical protein [Candidatus Hydrogenedentota bacterium]HPG65894.1 hypothetical protein [Candidatus Hydrogenedentota bacterium]